MTQSPSTMLLLSVTILVKKGEMIVRVGERVTEVSPYAAPARAESLAGLPPAFVQTNGLDPLRDEGIQYAMRLMAAGIDVELYNAPGAYHGADPLDPRTAFQAARVYHEALNAALDPA